MAYPTKWGYLWLKVDNWGTSTAIPVLTLLRNNLYLTGLTAGGKWVYGSAQMPNDYIPGTDITVEVRYSCTTALGGNIVLDFEYSLASKDIVFPASTVLTTGAIPATGVAMNHTLYTYGTVIPGGGIGGVNIGDVIVWRLQRNATGNTYAGGVLLLSIGLKYMCDVGSNSAYIKQY
jgi:hypothetical protein